MWIEKGRRPWLVPAIAATLCGGLAAFMFTRTGEVDALIDDGHQKKAAAGQPQQPAPWDPSKPYKLQSASWDLSVPPAMSGRTRRGARDKPQPESVGGTPSLEVGVVHR